MVFDPNIDLLEINAVVDYKQVVEKARQLWSAGLPYYYSAGSDTDYVWNQISGLTRLFIYTSCKPNPKAFTQAMRNGHSYVSFGPIVHPKNAMFGDAIKQAENQ